MTSAARCDSCSLLYDAMGDYTPHPDAPRLAPGGDGTYYGPAGHVPGSWLARLQAGDQWMVDWGDLPAGQIVQARPRPDVCVYWSAAVEQQLSVIGPTLGIVEVGGCQVKDGQVMLTDRAGNWIMDVPSGGTVPVIDDAVPPAPIPAHFDDCDRPDGHPGCCPYILCYTDGCTKRGGHDDDHGPADA